MSRERGKVETPEYGKMVRRMIRSFARRVGDADPEDLADMIAVQTELDAAITAAVRAQVDGGRSWTEIGEAAGISRQAAYKRWGKQHDLTPDQQRLVLRALAAR